MTNKLVSLTKFEDLKVYILIISIVFVWSMPNLTVDVLISTHSLQKVDILWHPTIIPFVSGNPYGSDLKEISTATDLYTNNRLN